MEANQTELGKKLDLSLLAAFYSGLLTLKQQNLIHMYCDEDLSLSEISSQSGISRQAVSENLNRSFQKMNNMEENLGLIKHFQFIRKSLETCLSLMDDDLENLKKARHLISDLIENGVWNNGV